MYKKGQLNLMFVERKHTVKINSTGLSGMYCLFKYYFKTNFDRFTTKKK